jgi:transcriptional regulator with XRE-family HTH domain
MAREQDQPSLGQVVRRHRTSAGLTQQELARRAGLSVRVLRDLEHDRVTRPRAPSIRRLQAALGLSDQQRAELLARRMMLRTHGTPHRNRRLRTESKANGSTSLCPQQRRVHERGLIPPIPTLVLGVAVPEGMPAALVVTVARNLDPE